MGEKKISERAGETTADRERSSKGGNVGMVFHRFEGDRSAVSHVGASRLIPIKLPRADYALPSKRGHGPLAAIERTLPNEILIGISLRALIRRNRQPKSPTPSPF